MNINLFKPPKLKEAIFDFVFDPFPKIETRLAPDFAKNLSSIFEQDYNLTRVDETAPVTIPRFVLSSRNKRVLEVSLVKATFKGDFEGLELPKAISLLRDNVIKTFNYIKSNNDIRLDGFGLSVLINYPLKDTNFPVKDALFDKFYKIKKPAGLKEVSFTIGQEAEDFTLKTAVAGYEYREMDRKSIDLIKNRQHTHPNIFKIPISEMALKDNGIAFRLTVNENENVITKHPDITERFNRVLDNVNTAHDYANAFIFGD